MRQPACLPALAFLGMLLAFGWSCSPAAAPSPSAPATSGASPVTAGGAKPESAAPTAVPREAVRIPYPALSLSSLPHWLAYDAGLYEREGLDVTMDYVASSTTLAPALLSGEIGMAYAGQEIVIASGVQGGDLTILAAGLEKPLFWLSVNPSVRTPADLRGKRLGVTRFGSSSDTTARYYLPTVGLQPDGDVTILQMGGNPEMVGALQSGGIDAAILSPPSVFQARRNGAVTLADLGELDLPFYQNALVTSRRFLGDRPETVRRAVRAYAAAWPLLQDERAAVASLKRYSGETDDELVLETYRAGVRRFPASPLPRTEPIRMGLQQLAARESAAQGVNPEQFIAPEFMAAALAAPARP